jgi:hypothetical protein
VHCDSFFHRFDKVDEVLESEVLEVLESKCYGFEEFLADGGNLVENEEA